MNLEERLEVSERHMSGKDHPMQLERMIIMRSRVNDREIWHDITGMSAIANRSSIFGENNSQASRWLSSIRVLYKFQKQWELTLLDASRYDLSQGEERLGNPYSCKFPERYIPMQNPRSSIVGLEPNRHIIPRRPCADNVAPHRVNIVIRIISGTSDNVEWMLTTKKFNFYHLAWSTNKLLTPCRCRGCYRKTNSKTWKRRETGKKARTGFPTAAVVRGKDISTTWLGGREYTEPDGSKSCAAWAPLKIWRRTGTVGGVKDTSLIVNALPLNPMFMARFTSAAPAPATPGGVDPSRGCSSVSKSKLLLVSLVTGSTSSAPEYLRIAELIPPSKPGTPLLGFARIQ